MPDELRLREQARETIGAGKFPSRAPDRTWGGPGVGAPCQVCDKPVTNSEMEFEIEFTQDGGGGLDKFHVHIRCFAAWEFERNKPYRSRETALPAERAHQSTRPAPPGGMVRDAETTSVIAGRLHAVDGHAIVLGGSIRITLLPGVKVPDVPIGTSLTIVLVRRDRRTFAESIRATFR